MSADSEKHVPAGWTAADFVRSSTELWQNWIQNIWPGANGAGAMTRPAGPITWPAPDARLGDWQAAWEYWVDACQRTILFWDVMRQRGNTFLEHEAKGKPPLLVFDHQMVLDGRTLDPPVNYFLVRIVPPAGVSVDPRKRPFIVFDPRGPRARGRRRQGGQRELR